MTHKIQLRHRFGMSGHFRLITRSPRYGEKVRAEFDNLILNQGLDRVAQGEWIPYCQVGTGSTAPANGQTSLVAWVAGSATPGAADADSYVSGGTPYHQLIRTRRFDAGTATGTLAEVGMGWGSGGSTLFSRALILDGGGSPTTITVLSDETLDVEYTLRIYPPTADVAGTEDISGVDYDYTVRAADVGTDQWKVSSLVAGAICTGNVLAMAKVYPSTSTIGPTTGRPSGVGINATSMTPLSYTTGTYTRSKELSFGLSVVPSGGVKCLVSEMGTNFGGCVMQMDFDPVIPKDGTNVLNLVVSVSWARH